MTKCKSPANDIIKDGQLAQRSTTPTSISPGLGSSLYHWERAEHRFSVEKAILKTNARIQTADIKNMAMSVVDLRAQGLLYFAIRRQTVRDTAWDIEPPGERCRSPIGPNRF